MDQPAFTQPAPVEADIVRTEAIRQRREEEEILVDLVYLQIQMAGLRVPKDWEQTINGLQVRGELVDGCRGLGINGKEGSGEQNTAG